jgi:hypothetical protein
MASSSGSITTPYRLYNSPFLSSRQVLEAQNQSIFSPRTLQCLTAKILLEQCNSMPRRLENVLETYKMAIFIQSLALSDADADASGLKTTLSRSKLALNDQFPALFQKFGRDYLIDLLGDKIFHQLMERYEWQLGVKSKMASYRSGIVLQAEKLVDVQQSREGYYPLAALLQGVEWPDNVDPSRREEYLDPQEFEHIFGMTRESFISLPKFQKMRLKKENRLF